VNLHGEILPPAQEAALRKIARPATEHGFYLGGGTAIAVHLGHRQSQDLDWFTSEPIEDPLAIARALRERGGELQVENVARGALHGRVGGVRASFLEYRHPMLAPSVIWPDVGCEVASLDDLAAMKLLAVDQRGRRRDFCDIHALAANGRPLAEILELFRRKFSVEDTSRVLYSLTYFADAEPDPTPRMLNNVTWEQVKADIRAWVKTIAAASG
jgi:hypothetical protein